MGVSCLEFSIASGIATIRLNRPTALNAMNTEMLDAMLTALAEVETDKRARVLLISGAGRAFSAGADLAMLDRDPDVGKILETHFNPIIEKIAALHIPVITSVGGVAAGAGCSLALAGDLVVAAQTAYFLLAFVNIGLIPDCGLTWLLPRLVGRARATAMMMLGARIGAAQALDWGMIYKVVDDAELDAAALELASRLACGPTIAYGGIRRSLATCLAGTLKDALSLERQQQKVAGATKDFSEGVAAFLARRPAAFRGE